MLARMRMGHHRLGLRNLGAVSILAALCAVASCRCGGGGNAPLLCAPTPSGMTVITNIETGATLGSPVLVEECEQTIASR